MSVIEALRKWLLTCPLLEGQRLNTNYLGPEAAEYALVETPVEPVVAAYLDGSTTRQKAVALTAVQDYSPDLLLQLAASGFWEALTAWVEGCSEEGDLPDLGPGREADAVEITAAHYVLHTSATTARYQLQLRLLYDQFPTDPD